MSIFSGVKILDLSSYFPGSLCTQLLADYGAEVIKIEEPIVGDSTRIMEPFISGIGSRHLIINRNKKSIGINLKDQKGKEIFKKLAKTADVILEGFRPGVMKRLGLDYDEISKINSQIIYCSITGYGQTGPYNKVAGHDLNYIGISGVLDMTGEKNEKPSIPGTQIADIGGGSMMALSAISMALFYRERTNEGQYIDISMTDGMIMWQTILAANYFGDGNVPEKGKTHLTGKYPYYNVYETKDKKYIAVAALEEKFWEELCESLEKSDWIELRKSNQLDQLKNEMTDFFKTKDRAYWLERLQMKDTCVSPVNNLEETFNDPHVKAREMIFEVKHSGIGDVKQIGFPIKFSKTPGKYRNKAPDHGENTEQILKEIGYCKDEIKTLKDNRIVK